MNSLVIHASKCEPIVQPASSRRLPSVCRLQAYRTTKNASRQSVLRQNGVVIEREALIDHVTGSAQGVEQVRRGGIGGHLTVDGGRLDAGRDATGAKPAGEAGREVFQYRDRQYRDRVILEGERTIIVTGNGGDGQYRCRAIMASASEMK